MIRAFTLASSFPKTCVRRLSMNQISNKKPDLSEIKKKQIHFQLEDDTPVYLKGGSLDYVLFYATLGLTMVGVGLSSRSLYNLIKN